MSDRLPLLVAVTGHRDLVAAEVAGIRSAVRDCLADLVARYPEREVTVMSALAAGADQLAADTARELGCPVLAVLPMPLASYRTDFDSADALADFEHCLAAADEVLELPLAPDASPDAIEAPGAARDAQYARLGVFLAAHCHVLLAIWDGKPPQQVGGTGHVVQFHHDDVMPGHTGTVFATRQMLIDDESDLVFHVVCSRDRPDGAPAEGLAPLDTCWFTKDATHPRSAELPAQHVDIFAHSATFSRDARAARAHIEANAASLAGETPLPPGAREIDRWYRAADTLASLYQRKVVRTLRLTHGLAFLMGSCFILYADVQTERAFMLGFLALFGCALAVGHAAKRGDWTRKYLDYRALAEGLRVQFYWALAGVRDENASRFMHDNFLRTQDPTVGWIRNVMRVAGLRSDARPPADAAQIDVVVREWIGGSGGGQLGYFERRSAARTGRHRMTERLERLSLATSVAMVAFFVVAGGWLPEAWTGVLLAAMGALLLAYGIREGYAYAVAEKELIKQYSFMWRLFESAGKRLAATTNDEEKRQILRALGRAALDEHSEWILMQRNRAVESSEVWRMGS